MTQFFAKDSRRLHHPFQIVERFDQVLAMSSKARCLVLSKSKRQHTMTMFDYFARSLFDGIGTGERERADMMCHV